MMSQSSESEHGVLEYTAEETMTDVCDRIHQDLTRMKLESTDRVDYASSYEEYVSRYRMVFEGELERLVDQHIYLKARHKVDEHDQVYLDNCEKINKQISLYYAIDNNYFEVVRTILGGWKDYNPNVIRACAPWHDEENMAWLQPPLQRAIEKRRPDIVNAIWEEDGDVNRRYTVAQGLTHESHVCRVTSHHSDWKLTSGIDIEKHHCLDALEYALYHLNLAESSSPDTRELENIVNQMVTRYRFDNAILRSLLRAAAEFGSLDVTKHVWTRMMAQTINESSPLPLRIVLAGAMGFGDPQKCSLPIFASLQIPLRERFRVINQDQRWENDLPYQSSEIFPGCWLRASVKSEV